MKHKSLLTVLVVAIVATSVGGMALTTHASPPPSNAESFSSDERYFIVPSGETENKPEFWEISEYENWMEQERAYYQGLADDGDKSFWYKNDDEVYVCREWTQKDIDTLYSEWQEQLSLMKQGHHFTKTITLPDGGLLVGEFDAETLNAKPSVAPGSTIITMPDKSIVDLGDFYNSDEAVKAVSDFLKKQTKQGILTQKQADAILANGAVE